MLSYYVKCSYIIRIIIGPEIVKDDIEVLIKVLILQQQLKFTNLAENFFQSYTFKIVILEMASIIMLPRQKNKNL